MTYLFLILGLVTLIVGGEFLVNGAVGIAKRAQISTLVIGMTVISFGTSAPELIVSIKAALSGVPEIAIGNVIGSNIANIALVLGITVLIFPIVVDKNSKIIDWPMMFISSVLFYLFFLFFGQGYLIERWEGVVLFLLLLAFIFFLIYSSRKKTKQIAQDAIVESDEQPKKNIWTALGSLALGMVGLYFGAEWLLDSAVTLATDFGMTPQVIGLTVVAFGTSVPELVTSAVAAFKKETDISIGNLIGSNIFNIMAVIGITAIVKPIEINAIIAPETNYNMLWMLGISFALLPLMIIGKKLGRLKGFILFATYVVYITLVVMASQPS